MWIETYRLNGDKISIRASEIIAATERHDVQSGPVSELVLRTSADVMLVSESRETIVEKVNQVALASRQTAAQG